MHLHDPSPIPVTTGLFTIMSIHVPSKNPMTLVLEQREDEQTPGSITHHAWGRFTFDGRTTIFHAEDLTLYEQPREGWYQTPMVWRASCSNIETGSIMVDDASQTGIFGFRESDGPDPTANHILDLMTKFTLDLHGIDFYWDKNSLYGRPISSHENEDVERELLREIKAQWEVLEARKRKIQRQERSENPECEECWEKFGCRHPKRPHC